MRLRVYPVRASIMAYDLENQRPETVAPRPIVEIDIALKNTDTYRVLRDSKSYEKAYEDLYAWCKGEGFAGYDPFDGLNSRFFRALPLKKFAPARLMFLQLVKRSSWDLRPILGIERGVNPKSIALFALAELSRYRSTGDSRHKDNAKRFLSQLDELKLPLSDGKVAWGYNFDWQSRAFFAPRGTPTIVPTAFAAKAFVEAYDLFGDGSYLETARGVCAMIEQDLHRVKETDDEVTFSYTPLDRSVIFNASLLAAECLADVGSRDKDKGRLNLAVKAVRFVLRRQREDGAWAYGLKLRHSWVDNFHTAYILLSLTRISAQIPELREETDGAFASGMRFWLENMFLSDGTPKYYDSATYPVDIHSASAAIVALSELSSADERCHAQSKKVLDWTMANMRDESGYFYYQVRRSRTVKTAFIRWGEAWMAYALAKSIEADG